MTKVDWQDQDYGYISCNSATLARDAGVLVNTKGYKCKGVGIINMFQHFPL